MSTLPLEGITVVSLEHAIAAPFATRQLADLGARVIKIERPGDGDFARAYDQRVLGQSSHFVWCNRSKESVTLDLKSQGGIGAVRTLIANADVFVQNLAPGATSRMGLDFASLHASQPTLIVCDISGYGQDGPYRDRKAYDLLIQSEAGFLSATGTPDEMVKAGCSIADIAAGVYAYSNILSALLLRQRTGVGRHIDISMLEAMTEWMGFPLYYAFDGAQQAPRVGASHATIYPYGPFATATGEVMLGIQNEREWSAFCEIVLDRPELEHDARFATTAQRSANRTALDAEIHAAIGSLPSAEVVDRLDRAKIANANVNHLAEVWSHPQLAARGRWVEVDTPGGRIPALLPPGTVKANMGAVPAVGAHTAAVLAEFGLTLDEER